MVGKGLYDALGHAESAYSFVLIDKGVTNVAMSVLSDIREAELPRMIDSADIIAIAGRFNTWLSLLRSPHIQTVPGVAGEVYAEHDLLNHSIERLSANITDCFDSGKISEYDVGINETYLDRLVSLRDEFSYLPEFTKQNSYLSRDEARHHALFSRVLEVSVENESKATDRKEHDHDSTTDEQLVAAAMDYAVDFGSACILTSDSDITSILKDYVPAHSIQGSIGVYSLFERENTYDVFKHGSHWSFEKDSLELRLQEIATVK